MSGRIGLSFYSLASFIVHASQEFMTGNILT